MNLKMNNRYRSKYRSTNNYNSEPTRNNRLNYNPTRAPRFKQYSSKKGRRFDANNIEPDCWTVKITNGKFINKDVLMNLLNLILEVESFDHFGYHLETSNVIFYVKEYFLSVKLRSISKANCIFNNQPFLVYVYASNCKLSKCITSVEHQLIFRQVLYGRYSKEKNMVNLGSISSDPQLREHNISIFLNTASHLWFIFSLIFECYPTLENLDISGNGIESLFHFNNIIEFIPCLKALNLSNNQIAHLKEFKHLRNLKHLEEVLAENNPTTQYSNWKNKLAELFPFLKFAKPVGLHFDFSEEASQNTCLPPIQGFFTPTDSALNLIQPFLENYINLFDSEDRAKLINYYFDNPMFSISAATNTSKYIKEIIGRSNQNLYKSEYNAKAVISCKISLIAYFKDSFCKTTHYIKSLNVDIFHQSETFIGIVLNGIFRRTDMDVLVSFSRVFNLINEGNGFLIGNEMLTISDPTDIQFKEWMTEYSQDFEFVNKAREHVRNQKVEVARSKFSHNRIGNKPQRNQKKQNFHNKFSSLNTEDKQHRNARYNMSTKLSSEPIISPFGNAKSLDDLSSNPTKFDIFESSNDKANTEMFNVGVDKKPNCATLDRASLVTRLIQTSNLKPYYAEKCLSDNKWNYEMAVSKFVVLKGTGKLPQHIFQS
ncbi:Nuclear RNA export factor 1 [Intoshia linei]|uniref:Nuclear RNA export factor 1 n=1 Tax=Intoshia linei TaxID=1819745 RepID=A0A177B8F0_9BILA|nr:Nuclear RNA export factor 1 [Intoshia linei]